MTYTINEALIFQFSIQFKNKNILIYKLNENPSHIEYFGYKIPIGQVFLREYITKQYRKTYIPWCFVSNNNTTFLTLDALLYWQAYSYSDKLIALYDNKILAIKVIHSNFNEIKKRTLYCSQNTLDTNKIISLSKFWLDMSNDPHYGIPIIEKEFYGKFHITNIYEIDETTFTYKQIKTLNYLKI